MRTFDLKSADKATATIEAFLGEIERVRTETATAAPEMDRPWYFRGDKDRTNLKPHIGRPRWFAGRTACLIDEEANLLHRFKRFAYQEFNRAATDWEALFLARHYDLPTRILDWSVSPLVALYFACSPRNKDATSGVVWGICKHANVCDAIDVFDSRPDRGPLTRYGETPAIKLVYPVYNSGRIIAQKGLFTWHTQPTLRLNDQANVQFDDEKLDISRLAMWPIEFSENAERVQLLKKLEELGFSSRTIFPDLEGIAAGLWQTRVLFTKEPPA